MKILLIYVSPSRHAWPRGAFLSRWAPTGVLQIAAELRAAGHDARVLAREEQLIKAGFDWRTADDAFAALLTDFGPDVVGFSVLTPGMPEMNLLADLVRQRLGDAPLLLAGGPHPTALPKGTLQECAALDAVAFGEAERTMVALADRLRDLDSRADRHVKAAAMAGLAGLAVRHGNGEISIGPPPALEMELDRFTPIDGSLLDRDHYTAPHRWMIRWLNLSAVNVRTSRGCTNRCRFCAGHLVAGVGVRYHSPAYVIERMREATEDTGVQAVLFEDETLGGDRERLLTLCEEIRRADLHRSLQWAGCLRVDQVDAELLSAMRQAGCVQIEYGFESGSDRMLAALGKRSTVDQSIQAVRLTRDAGIRVFANIMVGLPGETLDDLRATERFLRRSRPEVLSFTRLNPLPGTAVWETLSVEQRLTLRWEDFTWPDQPGFSLNLTAMNEKAFDREYRRFRKYIAVPAIDRQILRDTLPHELAGQRQRIRKVQRFALRHPIHALRLPI